MHLVLAIVVAGEAAEGGRADAAGVLLLVRALDGGRVVHLREVESAEVAELVLGGVGEEAGVAALTVAIIIFAVLVLAVNLSAGAPVAGALLLLVALLALAALGLPALDLVLSDDSEELKRVGGLQADVAAVGAEADRGDGLVGLTRDGAVLVEDADVRRVDGGGGGDGGGVGGGGAVVGGGGGLFVEGVNLNDILTEADDEAPAVRTARADAHAAGEVAEGGHLRVGRDDRLNALLNGQVPNLDEAVGGARDEQRAAHHAAGEGRGARHRGRGLG